MLSLPLPWSFAALERRVGLLRERETSSSSSCADDLLSLNDSGLQCLRIDAYPTGSLLSCMCRDNLIRPRGPCPRTSKAHFCDIEARIPRIINNTLTLAKYVENKHEYCEADRYILLSVSLKKSFFLQSCICGST